MKKIFLSTASLLLVVTASMAQVVGPAPQASQRGRIRQGVATGTLTPTEAARLRAREANITATKQAARADGVVTTAERRVVRSEERRTSRAIYRQKHDAQVR